MVTRLTVAVVILQLVLWATSQAQLPVTGLRDVQSVVRDASFSTVAWSLAFRHDSQEFPAREAEEAANALFTGILPSGAMESERQLFGAYGTALAGYIRGLRLMGGNLTGFLRVDTDPPVLFFEHEGRLGVVVSGVGVGVDFNTLNVDQLDRARRAVYQMILPEIGRLRVAVQSTELHWIGIALHYGTRDFTDRYDIGDGEMTLAIFPVDRVASFQSFAITDAELVDTAMVFVGSFGSMRRVDVNR